jgi:3-methyladenine DNA glycosylase AlkD
MTSSSEAIIERLRQLGDTETAAHSRRFFKTGPGEYGEGDVFLGIRVPVIRGCARDYRGMDLAVSLGLLESPFHEARLLALIMMVEMFHKAKDECRREEIYRAYLDKSRRINNWDLVDCSAEHIIGAYLFPGDRCVLYNLARSESLWERRIAIMATFHFIRRKDFADTLAIAEMLLKDREDLIHKAVGWMLREVGKRDIDRLRGFLGRHATKMPRTMLRYAIERFPEGERQLYLHGGKVRENE